ncbi:hypothetical protein BKA67DRAFT_540951 [Truncatella angustata]|uniref:Uncharacterized protein n=1 Tax=Truncatella angustata TaxID=152316 RepID=A0A9P8RKH1_9PEZI|nr:uncharacterized protein BKA67DRAFT_540951 [Truncatella angustata]KAH6645958.1 hypothetical protein BKA67DRAFT_540951 [Truncatella angustata]
MAPSTRHFLLLLLLLLLLLFLLNVGSPFSRQFGFVSRSGRIVSATTRWRCFRLGLAMMGCSATTATATATAGAAHKQVWVFASTVYGGATRSRNGFQSKTECDVQDEWPGRGSAVSAVPVHTVGVGVGVGGDVDVDVDVDVGCRSVLFVDVGRHVLEGWGGEEGAWTLVKAQKKKPQRKKSFWRALFCSGWLVLLVRTHSGNNSTTGFLSRGKGNKLSQ